jgi:hypothetical protein
LTELREWLAETDDGLRMFITEYVITPIAGGWATAGNDGESGSTAAAPVVEVACPCATNGRSRR